MAKFNVHPSWDVSLVYLRLSLFKKQINRLIGCDVEEIKVINDNECKNCVKITFLEFSI